MIPVYLEATNFMTYQHLTLDFTLFKIACLSGNNGSGKSTILDALTWSLWEESRSSNSDDIIRLGEQEVRVEFVFRLEGQTYRILRTKKRSKPGKAGSGKAGLEFQVLSESGYRSLTGKTMRESQQRIRDVLNMDYNLFIHSSFILQGRADIFTISSPSERKKILADILNLEAYDRLQEEAKKKRDVFTAQRNQSKLQLEQWEEQLKQEPLLQQQLAEAQHQHQHLQTSLQENEAQLGQLQLTFTQLQQKKSVLEQTEKQVLALKQVLQEKEQALSQLEQEQQAMAALLMQQNDIEQGYQKGQALGIEKERLEELAEQYSQLKQQQNQLEQQLVEAKHLLEIEQATLDQQIQQMEREKGQYQKIIADKEKTMTGYEKYLDCLKNADSYQKKYQVFQDLDRERQELEQKKQKWMHQAEIEQKRLEALLEEKQKNLQAQQPELLEAELKNLTQRLEQLDQKQVQLNRITEEGIQYKAQIEQTKQQCTSHDEELEKLRLKLQQLQLQQETLCPMCERLLTADDIQVLIDKYQQQFQMLEHERRDKLHRISELENKRETLLKQYQLLSRDLKERDGLQQKSGQLEQQRQVQQDLAQEVGVLQFKREHLLQRLRSREETLPLTQRLDVLNHKLVELDFQPNDYNVLQAAVQDWQWADGKFKELRNAETQVQQLDSSLAERHPKQAQLQQNLQQEAFLPEERAQLTQLIHQLEPLQGVPEHLKTVRADFQHYSTYTDRWQQLQQALTRKIHLQEQRESLEPQVTGARTTLQELQVQLEKREALSQQYQQTEGLLQDQQQMVQQLREQEKSVHAQCYALEKEKEAFVEKKQLQRAEKAKLKEVEQEVYLYKELIEMFGKNGIQALIIENAIPEIEHIANQMLGQMTDGRMHIQLKTLKTFKTQDKLAETLDILISDELGTRSYETYSAGEAFRVNFAIRLAISKFLARRAGSKLQTLVIDEGFGSQDSDGKTRIVEAINTVAHEFETILVITHVDDLKALFPCRIEVVKQNNGSHIKIVV